MVALQAPSMDAKGQTADEDRLGDAVELQRELGNDAERAFRADQETGEIVAGGGLACPAAGGDHAAVGKDRGEAEHGIAHGAVAHGVGAGGARRRHAAEARIGAGIDREEETEIAQVIVEGFAGDAGLHHAIEVSLMHGKDAVHAGEIEREAAVRRVEVTFERGAGAERDHRNAGARAKSHHLGDLGLGLGEQHGVGRLGLEPGERVGMLLPKRLAQREAVTEARGKSGEEGLLALRRGAGERLCHGYGHGRIL